MRLGGFTIPILVTILAMFNLWIHDTPEAKRHKMEKEGNSWLDKPDQAHYDPWNTQVRFETRGNQLVYLSAGPDRKWETDDDAAGFRRE